MMYLVTACVVGASVNSTTQLSVTGAAGLAYTGRAAPVASTASAQAAIARWIEASEGIYVSLIIGDHQREPPGGVPLRTPVAERRRRVRIGRIESRYTSFHDPLSDLSTRDAAMPVQ